MLRVLRVWRERFIFPDDYLNGLQATFLRPALIDLLPEAASHPSKPEADVDPAASDGQAAQAAAAGGLEQLPRGNAELKEALEALPEDEVLRKTRLMGLSTRGGRVACLHRLLALDEYLSNEGGGGGLAGSLGLQLGAARRASHAGGKWGAAGEGTGDGSGVRLAGGVEGIIPGLDGMSSDDEGALGLFGLPSVKQEGGGGLGHHLSGVLLAPDPTAPPPAAAAAGLKVEPGLGSPRMAPVASPAAPPAVPIASRWMEVDEEEERQKVPQVPISKWLLAEQEAQAQAAAAERAAAEAAAAAAEAQRQAELQAAAAAVAEAMGSRGQADVDGAQVASRHHWHQPEEPALNEERRQKLRQVCGYTKGFCVGKERVPRWLQCVMLLQLCFLFNF